MEEPEKPFPCSVEGCNMKFADVDHLAVHKKKHNMVLNLGNGQKSGFVADQTPTPTRFIRNCEEVGLFQDLQIVNVNPFEETFRKAVESGKTGFSSLNAAETLSVPAGSDDTLHTPHVFPYITEDYKRTSTTCNAKTSEDTPIKQETREESPDIEVVSESPKEIEGETDPLSSSKRLVFHADLSDNKNTASTDASALQLVLRMPDGKLLHFSSATPTSSSQTSETEPLSLPGDSKRPPVITVSDCDGKEKSEISEPSSKHHLVKQKLRETLTGGRNVIPEKATATKIITPKLQPTRKKDQRLKRQIDGNTDDQRQKFLERNRVAAMRCREKRKNWVKELQRRGDDMKALNQQLQNEVSQLKAEVAHLKTLLLAHKDCPVTLALQQGCAVSTQQEVISVPVSVTAPPLQVSTPVIAPKIARILPMMDTTTSKTVNNVSSPIKKRPSPENKLSAKRVHINPVNNPKLSVKSKVPALQTVTLSPATMDSIPTASIVGPIIRSTNGNIATITPGVLLGNQPAAILQTVNPQIISLSVLRQPTITTTSTAGTPVILPKLCVRMQSPPAVTNMTQRQKVTDSKSPDSSGNHLSASSGRLSEALTKTVNESGYDSDVEIVSVTSRDSR